MSEECFDPPKPEPPPDAKWKWALLKDEKDSAKDTSRISRLLWDKEGGTTQEDEEEEEQEILRVTNVEMVKMSKEEISAKGITAAQWNR